MKAKTFIGLMFLLLVFTTSLVVLAAPPQKQVEKNECPAGPSSSEDTRVQSAEGGMIWESVSRHLLSVVQ